MGTVFRSTKSPSEFFYRTSKRNDLLFFVIDKLGNIILQPYLLDRSIITNISDYIPVDFAVLKKTEYEVFQSIKDLQLDEWDKA